MDVLVVDDHQENMYLLQSLLTGKGHQVHTAGNGAQALEIINARGIDLIISDILMPIMDGYQLLKEVKGDQQMRLIPFIFYTATYTSAQDQELAFKLGADRFIVKPCEPEEFMAVVDEAARKAGHNCARDSGVQTSEEEVYKLYSQRLVHKLEDKMEQLESEIARRTETEAALRREQGLFRIASDLAKLGAWRVDFLENSVFWSDQMTEIYETEPGYTPTIEKVIALCAPEYRERMQQAFDACAGQGTSFDLEAEIMAMGTKRKWVRIRGMAERDEEGKIVGIQGGTQDISERKWREEQLKYLSLYDQLTGLYNRAYLENELQRLEKSKEFPVTIVCMDLDGLKLINDTLGHEHGDSLLKDCARIIQQVFRISDVPARAGGDEFVVLMPRTKLRTGEEVVDGLRLALDAYNNEQGDRVPLNLSIGLAGTGDGEMDLNEAFKQADDLMYRDKLNRDKTARSQIMKGLMAALEERDFITHGHVHRLEDLCHMLGQKFDLSHSQLSDLALLCQVHDLGKVGIPDHILFKPGPLSAEEWKIMRQHAEKGYRIALATNDLAGIAELILKHHERWDGTGYPLGLSGRDIPVECRILAIVDSFDAMTNDRPYRKAMQTSAALKELKRCAGTQFDPELVDAFVQLVAKS